MVYNRQWLRAKACPTHQYLSLTPDIEPSCIITCNVMTFDVYLNISYRWSWIDTGSVPIRIIQYKSIYVRVLCKHLFVKEKTLKIFFTFWDKFFSSVTFFVSNINVAFICPSSHIFLIFVSFNGLLNVKVSSQWQLCINFWKFRGNFRIGKPGNREHIMINYNYDDGESHVNMWFPIIILGHVVDHMFYLPETLTSPAHL